MTDTVRIEVQVLDMNNGVQILPWDIRLKYVPNNPNEYYPKAIYCIQSLIGSYNKLNLIRARIVSENTNRVLDLIAWS